MNDDILAMVSGVTPLDLREAHEAGSALVKLFPAQLGGSRYLKDILAPWSFLKLVPTGGFSPGNARDYIAAGTVAGGIGGQLVSNKRVAAGACGQMTLAARACAAAIK